MEKYVIDVVKNATDRMKEFCDTPLRKVVAASLEDYLEYRKLEEQGLLLKLPFKVGDVVYSAEYEEVKAYTITSFRVYETDIYAYEGYTYIGEVGMSVFATKEEAKKALEEMEEMEE